MSGPRKWRYITVSWEGRESTTIHATDFDKFKEIEEVLAALVRVKGLKYDLDRLLGGGEN